MAFLRSVGYDPLPILRGEGLYLRTPAMSDHPAWAELRDRSRGFLTPWEPIWPEDDLDRSAFRRRVKRYGQEIRNDGGYPFFVFRAVDHALVGGLTLSHVRRGVTQAAALGYWMGEPFAGQGLMSEAVRTVLPFAFSTLRLHRVEAACLPHNAASVRLLEKVGFTREGYARRYLCINGSWQDHLLFAILAEDPVRPAAKPVAV